MTTGLKDSVIRPPPPRYCEAINYPAGVQSYTNFNANNQHFVENTSSYNLYQTVPEISENVKTGDLHQTLPGEIVYVYQPHHLYSNVSFDSYRKLKYLYKFKKGIQGHSVIVLEAIPETLASSQDSMGVKTYAQLEVVEPGSQQESSMCGVSAVNGCDRVGGFNRCMEIQPNGKTVHVPINGLIPTDRMIVDTLLNDSSCENWNHEAMPSPTDSPDCSLENGDGQISPVINQVDRDLENLAQALEKEDKAGQSGENTPLLQDPSAQFSHNESRHDSSETKSKRKCESDPDYADSGYSDSNRVEFKEHVTDHSTEHVLDSVIYSEPEYSSSDLSIKCTGETLNNALDKYQRTLKRTNNGTDHTVYELSPSDSFYSSADNVQTVGKRNSIASGDGICRIGQSSSSLTEGQRSRHPLNRDTSVSFKQPLVDGTSDDTSGVDMQPAEPQAELAAAEPLVSANAKQTASCEAIPSHLILEDTRTYYRRKAADRGTLYCAAGGITVVATIVFLLIYFS